MDAILWKHLLKNGWLVPLVPWLRKPMETSKSQWRRGYRDRVLQTRQRAAAVVDLSIDALDLFLAGALWGARLAVPWLGINGIPLSGSRSTGESSGI